MDYITDDTKVRRVIWLDKIEVDHKFFGDVSGSFTKDLDIETQRDGKRANLDHLRVCGNIPEK